MLADHLAETALGVTRQTSFADGIRLDGYGPTKAVDGPRPLMGAVAPTAEPTVRAGLEAPQAFSEVTEAIHRILEELPVPEEAKPSLRHSAVKPLTLATLAADKSLEDQLDEVVATSPVIEDAPVIETAPAPAATVAPEAAPAAPAAPAADAVAEAAPTRSRRKTNLLTRRYRITHFWPRSWVRTVRRAQAARAARLAAAAIPDLVPA